MSDPLHIDRAAVIARARRELSLVESAVRSHAPGGHFPNPEMHSRWTARAAEWRALITEIQAPVLLRKPTVELGCATSPSEVPLYDTLSGRKVGELWSGPRGYVAYIAGHGVLVTGWRSSPAAALAARGVTFAPSPFAHRRPAA